MVVELISVGTELLLGNIVNTNAAYLAEKCAGLGLSCYYQTVVGDNSGRLAGTIRTALERSDLVILTGGLGPTQDDLQIILGRPKASRQNHKIRPFQRRPYCPRKPSAIVAHHCLIIAGQSQPRTFLRQVCCVGVDYVPQQKLSSYRN